ncbi:MAG: heparinase II/III-family protein [Prevotella sp.]|nr:heparinase II/III-family protein [Prevotella sp.]
MKKTVLNITLAILVSSPSLGQDARIDKYIALGDTWLSDRLQMHWRTHATQQFMKGDFYHHCGGDSAQVPTLQINGARSHVTKYRRPKLEELTPRQEDERGMYLQNLSLDDKPYEWATLSQTGCIIGSINQEISKLALDAARRWKATGNDAYRRSALNVLSTYMLGVLHTNMPYDIDHGHSQTLFGLQTLEVIHEETVPYLTETYGILRPTMTASDCAQIDAAFKHWADIIEANGVPHNNWNLMQARFIFNIGQVLLPNNAYSDGKGQQHYFDIVENGNSIRQWGLKTLCDYGYDKHNGIWCECPGYSQGVLGDLAEFVRLYRTQLGVDLTQKIPVIVKAAKANVEYLFPDSMTIGFGDTHPARPNMAIYDKLGIDYSSLHPSRTFAAPKTSWLIQRTGMKPAQSLAFALNASDGNHMHANGISMELFARGQRMAPDGGIGYGLYSGDDYKEYYSQFPAHNTVCVDGVSAYPVMKSQHPFHIVRNDDTTLDNGMTVQASIVTMIEPETMSEQERTVVMIADKDDTGDGYFVDIFRSRHGKESKEGPEFHDYFYHNLGQQMTAAKEDGDELAMEKTEELAFAGAHLYAYSYLFDKKKAVTAENCMVCYSVNNDSLSMVQYAKGFNDRALYKALSPTTEGLSRIKGMPYDIKKQPTLTFVAHQQGEAWTRPFVNVFVPKSKAIANTVTEVAYPSVDIRDKVTKNAEAILVKHNNGRCELIVSADNYNAKVKVKGMTFKGRLNVVTIK